jgi:hypothetical protein
MNDYKPVRASISGFGQCILHETAHRYLELLTIRRVSAQNLTLFTYAVECTALKAVLVRRWAFVVSIEH